MLNPGSNLSSSPDPGLRQVFRRLSNTMERDRLVQQIVAGLRETFQVDRVVVYYFYRRWRGQVVYESLSQPQLSIFGSTGADDCFNQDYADLYLKGRINAIADIKQANIHPCHTEFLQSIAVQANLVAPVITEQGLWGLLVAHHSQPRPWDTADIETIRQASQQLAAAPSIRHS
ncbi:MAG: GAF domain-containing protein [Cyanobacteria bacterium P01_A01_bin.123]